MYDTKINNVMLHWIRGAHYNWGQRNCKWSQKMIGQLLYQMKPRMKLVFLFEMIDKKDFFLDLRLTREGKRMI